MTVKTSLPIEVIPLLPLVRTAFCWRHFKSLPLKHRSIQGLHRYFSLLGGFKIHKAVVVISRQFSGFLMGRDTLADGLASRLLAVEGGKRNERKTNILKPLKSSVISAKLVA
jgi:hypothetical protein